MLITCDNPAFGSLANRKRNKLYRMCDLIVCQMPSFKIAMCPSSTFKQIQLKLADNLIRPSGSAVRDRVEFEDQHETFKSETNKCRHVNTACFIIPKIFFLFAEHCFSVYGNSEVLIGRLETSCNLGKKTNSFFSQFFMSNSEDDIPTVVALDRQSPNVPSPAVVFARQYAQNRGIQKLDYRKVVAQRALHRRMMSSHIKNNSRRV